MKYTSDKLPKLKYNSIHKNMDGSNLLYSKLWNYLPKYIQWFLTFLFGRIFHFRMSLLPFKSGCIKHGLTEEYLDLFCPPDGGDKYKIGQDFFTRKLKNKIVINSEYYWPCEGYICDLQQVRNIKYSFVKGVKLPIEFIFGLKEEQINSDYYFVNIFLQHFNYHRIHAPVSGVITRVQRIHGKLNMLRPWFYEKGNKSEPAFLNERLNIDIQDELDRVWNLSIIGGMGVGNIVLNSCIKIGEVLHTSQEIAYFKLGSTCCLISPIKFENKKYLDPVVPGESLNI